jgi:hypothetical protein
MAIRADTAAQREWMDEDEPIEKSPPLTCHAGVYNMNVKRTKVNILVLESLERLRRLLAPIHGRTDGKHFLQKTFRISGDGRVPIAFPRSREIVF